MGVLKRLVYNPVVVKNFTSFRAVLDKKKDVANKQNFLNFCINLLISAIANKSSYPANFFAHMSHMFQNTDRQILAVTGLSLRQKPDVINTVTKQYD